ncbi:MAG TPA: alpha/beta fold hydrolase [Permianibacter sp.]|nr:alpha/beta fold hydrolase [Permianibacter sp.]
MSAIAELPSPFVVPTREYTVAVDGIAIAIAEWGEPGGTPLLLLHGWLDNAGSFYSLAPLLAAAGFRCIAVDFAGHGASGHLPGGAQYHFIDGVYTLHAVQQQLGVPVLPLLGHSMGGALGLL